METHGNDRTLFCFALGREEELCKYGRLLTAVRALGAARVFGDRGWRFGSFVRWYYCGRKAPEGRFRNL